jgi:hypothetical protein
MKLSLVLRESLSQIPSFTKKIPLCDTLGKKVGKSILNEITFDTFSLFASHFTLRKSIIIL